MRLKPVAEQHRLIEHHAIGETGVTPLHAAKLESPACWHRTIDGDGPDLRARPKLLLPDFKALPVDNGASMCMPPSMATMMIGVTADANSADVWIDVIRSITVYTDASGKRAPYKLLLLLWLIGRLTNGHDPEFRFEDAETDLRDLLNTFKVGNSSPKPEHPFVYLASKPKLWQVTDTRGRNIFAMSAPLSSASSTPARENVTFLRQQATGRVSEEFTEVILDPIQRNQIVTFLLESEFPESRHEELLGRVGLSLPDTKSLELDESFHKIVLLAYEYRCSFCDFGAYLGDRPVSVAAAHVRTREMQGPSVIENGVALCALHHQLFDRGAIGLTVQEDRPKILVSQHLNIFEQASSRPLLALSNQPMRLPQRGYSPPATKHIDWHFKNLFKHPARH